MIRVLLAHDHALVRCSLVALLKAPDIQVVGEASNGREASEQARQLQPDVILMGLTVLDMDCLSDTQRLKELQHPAHVIVFSVLDQTAQAQAARRSGAHGYFILSNNRQELIDAIHTVYEGKLYASPLVASTFLADPR